MIKLMGKKINAILGAQIIEIILIWTYDVPENYHIWPKKCTVCITISNSKSFFFQKNVDPDQLASDEGS